MPYETLIVAYDTADQASDAVRAIRRLGIPASDIKRHPVDATSIEDVAAAPEEAGGGGLWSWLFGSNAVEDRIAVYKKALDRGGTVISVRVIEDEVESVRVTLDQYGPVDVAAA